MTHWILSEDSLCMTQRDAEAGSGAKTASIAHLIHELRLPLNAVVGFAELMSREVLGPMGSTRYLPCARDIGATGQHMLAPVRDIVVLRAARFVERGASRSNDAPAAAP